MDITARVTWGDPIDEIRSEWLRKGAPAEGVEEALAEAMLERRRHFRQCGFRDLLIAVGLFIAGGIAFWITRQVDRGEIRLEAKSRAIVTVAVFGAPTVGILLALRGVRRVFKGGESGEAATNLDYTD